MRNIYLSPCKRPSFATPKLSFHHPKAYLSHPETYTFRKSKSTPLACRDAACRVKHLITNTLQTSRQNRLSPSLWATVPPTTFHSILDVKISIRKPLKINISETKSFSLQETSGLAILTSPASRNCKIAKMSSLHYNFNGNILQNRKKVVILHKITESE